MRFLICTQVIDRKHPVLGFFHEWVRALAERSEHIEVICLEAGAYAFPNNVRVHSLGKERVSAARPFARLLYICRFYRLAWKLRDEYQTVFVHMNQEYLLLAGVMWKLMHKRMYMWRNHYAGSTLTDIAAGFCARVFYTSRFSYTARYRKALQMPVGVNIERFSAIPTLRVPQSILFLARMAPSKDPDTLLEALHLLHKQGTEFTATFAGSPEPEHEEYYRKLIERAQGYQLTSQVTFLPGISNETAADVYREHDLFVNCSPSGMFDKTLFEAAASGCLVLAKSADYLELTGKEYGFTDALALSDRLGNFLAITPAEREERSQKLREIAKSQSLNVLADRLVEAVTERRILKDI